MKMEEKINIMTIYSLAAWRSIKYQMYWYTYQCHNLFDEMNLFLCSNMNEGFYYNFEWYKIISYLKLVLNEKIDFDSWSKSEKITFINTSNITTWSWKRETDWDYWPVSIYIYIYIYIYICVCVCVCVYMCVYIVISGFI